MNKTVIAAIVTVGALLVLGLVAIFAKDSLDKYGTIAVMLVGAVAAVFAMKGPPPGRAGYSGLRMLALAFGVGAFFVALGLFAGCSTTYTVEHGELQVRPHGPAGVDARLLLSEDTEACRMKAEKASIKVAKDVARRICEVYPESCTWKE